MQHVALLEALGISASLVAARGLEPCSEAAELEVAEKGEDGKEHLLTPAAADAWRRMKAAAAADATPIFVVSAFRSIDRQAAIIKEKLSTGQKIQDILCVSAPPGFSEHHTGRAVDIGTVGAPNLETAFEVTPAFAWLRRRAGEFGFKLSYPQGNRHGYQYEPWHWCYAAQQGAPGDAARAARSRRA